MAFMLSKKFGVEKSKPSFFRRPEKRITRVRKRIMALFYEKLKEYFI